MPAAQNSNAGNVIAGHDGEDDAGETVGDERVVLSDREHFHTQNAKVNSQS